MTTAQLLLPTGTFLPADLGVAEEGARISFRQPVSPAGFTDAAWWPRTLDLTAELPPLVEVLWTPDARSTASPTTCPPGTPRRAGCGSKAAPCVSAGFTVGDPHTVTLTDSWGHERIDILVISPETDSVVAQRIFDIASTADDPYRADEILDRANRTTTAHGPANRS